MDRRKFMLSSSSMSVFLALGTLPLTGCGGGSSSSDSDADTDTGSDSGDDTSTDSITTLIIPPIIEDTGSGILLSAQSGSTEFFTGVASTTWGFNGVYLGPTIRVRQGDSVNLSVQNGLDETISSHWHGLHIPGDVDGGPHQTIASGETWTPTLDIVQQASFNWYHSHIHGSTGRHVYNGLAGLFIIDDDSSDALDLPNEYGVDDFPLIIQDKLFDDDGNLDYTVDNIPGGRFAGNTMLVNGIVDPVLEVEAKRIRFRLLNASNARFYNFSLSDGGVFYKVATEGGLLNEPVLITSLSMAPGERNEIIIDFTDFDVGQTLTLQSSNEEAGDTNLTALFDVLTFSVTALTTENPALPDTLNTVPDVDVLLASLATAPVDRTFDLAAGEINDLEFDMAVINHVTTQSEYEIWDIRGGGHPFHVHGCSFLILEDDGISPTTEERGWKDTVVTRGGTTGVKVLVQFNYLAADDAPFMYHCHILGHEDAGMMGQFTVVTT